MASSDEWFTEGYSPNISTECWLEQSLALKACPYKTSETILGAVEGEQEYLLSE